MCLTIPKQVILIKSGIATVESINGKQKVGSLVRVKKGDWVLTQNDVIINKISKKEAKEILVLFKKEVKK